MGIIKTFITLLLIFFVAFVFVKGFFTNKQLTEQVFKDFGSAIKSSIDGVIHFGKLTVQVFNQGEKKDES